jgi:hypothetical protein
MSQRRFGDLAVLLFFGVQLLDGLLTYMGVLTWGTGIEANPLIGSAMAHFGPATALAGAKLTAMAFGIVLHLQLFHTAVAVLTGFYVAVSIVPWTALFLLSQ